MLSRLFLEHQDSLVGHLIANPLLAHTIPEKAEGASPGENAQQTSPLGVERASPVPLVVVSVPLGEGRSPSPPRTFMSPPALSGDAPQLEASSTTGPVAPQGSAAQKVDAMSSSAPRSARATPPGTPPTSGQRSASHGAYRKQSLYRMARKTSSRHGTRAAHVRDLDAARGTVV